MEKQEDKAKSTELNQAAEMGIIDKKYAHENQDGEEPEDSSKDKNN